MAEPTSTAARPYRAIKSSKFTRVCFQRGCRRRIRLGARAAAGQCGTAEGVAATNRLLPRVAAGEICRRPGGLAIGHILALRARSCPPRLDFVCGRGTTSRRRPVPAHPRSTGRARKRAGRSRTPDADGPAETPGRPDGGHRGGAGDRGDGDRAVVVGPHPPRGLPARVRGAGHHPGFVARAHRAAGRHRQPLAGTRGLVAPSAHGVPGDRLRAARPAAAPRRRQRGGRYHAGRPRGLRRAPPSDHRGSAAPGGRSRLAGRPPARFSPPLRRPGRAGLDPTAAGLGAARAPARLSAGAALGPAGGSLRRGHDGAVGGPAARLSRDRDGRGARRRHRSARRRPRSARRSFAS